MTWLSRTFFSLCLLAPAAFAAQVTGGVALTNSRDPEVRSHRNFAGVVVWLEALGHPPGRLDPGKHAVMAQKNKTFTPHVIAIPAGGAVEFPNFDPIFHNAFSSYSGQVFDVGLYPPGHSRTVVFKREGVVRVFCNIHSAMSALIVVLPTPLFAVTDARGDFRIPDVAPGEYRVHVFHERALDETLHSLERVVKVTEDGLCLPQIAISETGFLQTTHKNKYGNDYPSNGEEDLMYKKGNK